MVEEDSLTGGNLITTKETPEDGVKASTLA
jgi:hypothetical protein